MNAVESMIPYMNALEALGCRDGVLLIPYDRWDVEHRFSSPDHTAGRFAAFLHGIDKFDPTLFGIGLTEARLMDPQQRILLELCYQVRACPDSQPPRQDVNTCCRCTQSL